MELEIVKEEIRDEVMKNIISLPSNQSCFDCGNKSPTWSSPYLGILLCIECAGRHRSYGTHISFVKSIDLDKWNKKQLKSLELTGNFYMKKQFEKLKIPKINSIYDYNNELILKIRKDIEKLVKENLKKDDYSSIEKVKKNENNYFKKERKNNDNIIAKLEKIGNINEEQLNKKPVKFNVKQKDISNKKETKKNKIKKLDIDFDFDNYKENDNENKNIKEESIDPKEIKGMKITRIDKKKALIEEKKKKHEKNKPLCQRAKEFIYYILCFWKNKN